MTEKTRPYIKYPEIPYLQNLSQFKGETSIFEKIDGANCQVSNVGWRIFPGSRGHPIASGRWDNLGGYKQWFTDFKKWAMSNNSLYSLPENVILFGEWTVPKEVKYPAEFQNKFVLIDLCKVVNSQPTFVNYAEAKSTCISWGLQDIIYLPETRIVAPTKRDIEKILINGPEEKMASEDIEGVVLKDYTSQPPIVGKWLASPYSEIQARIFRPEEKMYVNIPRIRKAHYRLMEEHPGVEDFSEEEFFQAVTEDVIKETGIVPETDFVLKKIRKFKRHNL